jgi:hypothetical protein
LLAGSIAAEPWPGNQHPQDPPLRQLALQRRQLVLVEECDEVLCLASLQLVAVLNNEWRVDPVHCGGRTLLREQGL